MKNPTVSHFYSVLLVLALSLGFQSNALADLPTVTLHVTIENQRDYDVDPELIVNYGSYTSVHVPANSTVEWDEVVEIPQFEDDVPLGIWYSGYQLYDGVFFDGEVIEPEDTLVLPPLPPEE